VLRFHVSPHGLEVVTLFPLTAGACLVACEGFWKGTKIIATNRAVKFAMI
jgi:hypothetical protein